MIKAARQKNSVSCGELLLRVLFESQGGICQIAPASYLRLGLLWTLVTVAIRISPFAAAEHYYRGVSVVIFFSISV